MKIINEIKEFAIKGNVMDMAIGIIIGAAFTSVVNSLVKDIINPFIGIFTKGLDFNNLFITIKKGTQGGPYASLAQAQADSAVTLNIGLFINSIISFTIVAVVLFFLVKAMNKLRRPVKVTTDPVTTKECDHCLSIVNLKAKRCPFCTSDLD